VRGRLETVKGRRERAQKIVDRLKDSYPARVELNFNTPLELAIATILSAQCTDRRVNEVTGQLFKKYRTVEDFASADPEVFEEEIRPTGFFRNKTRSILAFAQALVDKHDGRVPDTMEELLELAGIGRKTANVILGSAFDKREGIVVDTHVKRLARRLGLSGEDDPDRVEEDLMKLIAREEWTDFGLRMIQHGRYTCIARKPQCSGCPLEDLCPSAHSH
jgi:endonuclease-3